MLSDSFRQLCFKCLCVKSLIFTLYPPSEKFYMTVDVLKHIYSFCLFLFTKTFIDLKFYTRILVEVLKSLTLWCYVHDLIVLVCPVINNTSFLNTTLRDIQILQKSPGHSAAQLLSRNTSSWQFYKSYLVMLVRRAQASFIYLGSSVFSFKYLPQ